MTDALRFSGFTNRPAVPVIEQPQLIYVLTELLPGVELQNVRLPLNFALVLDQSGSMAGEKLRTMKEAVKNIIDQLQSDDVISIVSFSTRAQVLVEAQPVIDKDGIKAQVGRIREGGGTNLAIGLREGLRLVSLRRSEECVSRIVLLTDGEATDNLDDSRRLADEAGQRGLPIIALGFGKDWNEDFLFELADRSILADKGSHVGMADYIPAPKDANKIFQDVYRSMQIIAQEVQLNLRMVQGLEARRVWQVAPLIKDLGRNVIQGRAVTIPIGALEKAGAAFLIEIMLPPRPAGNVRFAQADVTYQLTDQQTQRQAVDLLINFSNDAAVYSQLNERVMNIVEKVQAFKLQTQALNDVEIGNVSGATQKLRQAVTILLAQGETELATQMQQEADHLEQAGQISSEGRKTIKLSSRKTVRLDQEE